MGRGRQKAKQAKVARKLKYYSPETDYAALERELTGKSSEDGYEDVYGHDYDEYDEYEDEFDEDDEAEDFDYSQIPPATD